MARSVTLKGNPLPLVGPQLRVGDKAPNATLRRSLAENYQLNQSAGKMRIYSVVPSLDTPVCAAQTKRFFQEAANLPNVQIFTISCDLPPAQTRFCGAEGIGVDKVTPLSDYKDLDFGNKYGVLIPDLRILCRAVFVVDATDTLRYVEYVPEVASHPNYDAILSTVKN